MARAQITMFVIVGIIVLLAVGAVFFLRDNTVSSKERQLEQEISALPSAAQAVRRSLEACVADTSEKAVFMFGTVGGRVTPEPWPGYYAYDKTFSVPYYYMNGVSYAPSLPRAEAILELFVEQNINACTAASSGLRMAVGGPTARVTIMEQAVHFFITLPALVQVGSGFAEIPREYYTSVNVRLRDAIGYAQEISKRAVHNDLYVHWDLLTTAAEHDFAITAYPEKDSTFVYKLIDSKSTLFKTEPFTLYFAAQVLP